MEDYNSWAGQHALDSAISDMGSGGLYTPSYTRGGDYGYGYDYNFSDYGEPQGSPLEIHHAPYILTMVFMMLMQICFIVPTLKEKALRRDPGRWLQIFVAFLLVFIEILNLVGWFAITVDGSGVCMLFSIAGPSSFCMLYLAIILIVIDRIVAVVRKADGEAGLPGGVAAGLLVGHIVVVLAVVVGISVGTGLIWSCSGMVSGIYEIMKAVLLIILIVLCVVLVVMLIIARVRSMKPFPLGRGLSIALSSLQFASASLCLNIFLDFGSLYYDMYFGLVYTSLIMLSLTWLLGDRAVRRGFLGCCRSDGDEEERTILLMNKP